MTVHQQNEPPMASYLRGREDAAEQQEAAARKRCDEALLQGCPEEARQLLDEAEQHRKYAQAWLELRHRLMDLTAEQN